MNVFLDTMIYLHCSPIEDIDFCEVLGTSSVTIVVPRITLRELDVHKSTHPSTKIRDRARRTLSYLEGVIRSSSEVREGVGLQFVPHMPQLDMRQYGLNPEWNDDLLIASVLDRQSQSSDETVLVTHDTAVRLTCYHLGIRTEELPERFRLPPELDERDEEIRQLKRDLLELQNARPRLSVTFAGTPETTARFSIRPPVSVDASVIAQRLQSVREALPTLPEETQFKNVPGLAAVTKQLEHLNATFLSIPGEEYQRYNRERDTYLKMYERHQHEIIEFENKTRRAFRFGIEIANHGSAPADDVDVSIHFPDGFAMFTEDDLQPEPSEPTPPVHPRSRSEMLLAGFRDVHVPLGMPHIPDLHRQWSAFSLKKTNSYDLTDHFRRIKHGASVEVPELFVVFDSHDAARSFHCDYVLRVANLTEPVEGRLHFIIEHDAE